MLLFLYWYKICNTNRFDLQGTYKQKHLKTGSVDGLSGYYVRCDDNAVEIKSFAKFIMLHCGICKLVSITWHQTQCNASIQLRSYTVYDLL